MLGFSCVWLAKKYIMENDFSGKVFSKKNVIVRYSFLLFACYIKISRLEIK